MRHLLKGCLTVLIIVIALLGMGQNGCPNGIGFWTAQDETILVGSSQPVPSAITSLRVINILPYEISLSWQDNSNNEESIRVERKTELVEDYAEISLMDANTIGYVDTTVSSSTTYFYRVRAQNENGYSMYSNEVSTSSSFNEIPITTSALTVYAFTDEKIHLNWESSLGYVAGYKIERKVGFDGIWSQIGIAESNINPESVESLYSDIDVISPTATYYYRMCAFNNDGDYEWSNVSFTTLPISPGCISIATSQEGSFAIREDGTLWAWGFNDYGQLGVGNELHRYAPIQVTSATDWSGVAGYNHYTRALKTDKTLWSFGYPYGNIPIQTASGVDAITPTNWAEGFSIILEPDGTLWGIGENSFGQLGLGDNTDKNVLTQVGTDMDWVSVACGQEFTIAVKLDGSVWLWGRNTYGQLGLGDSLDRNIPTQVK